MSNGLVRAVGLSLVILLVAAACDEPPPRALFTVNYYKTHQNDRLAKVKECEGNPTPQKSPDCMNALQAQNTSN